VLQPQRSPILGLPSIRAYTLCRRTTKFDVVTHLGMGFVFRGQLCPIPRVRGPALPNLGGYFLFMRTPFVAELPNLTCRRTWGGRLHSGGRESAPPPPQGAGSSAPQFWGYPLLMHTPFAADVVTHVGGACILGSVTPPIPSDRSSRASQFWGFSCIYAHAL